MFRPCSKSVQIMKHSIGSGRNRFSSRNFTPYDSTIYILNRKYKTTQSSHCQYRNANTKSGRGNTKIVMTTIIDVKKMLVICGTAVVSFVGSFSCFGYFIYTQLEVLKKENKISIKEGIKEGSELFFICL